MNTRKIKKAIHHKIRSIRISKCSESLWAFASCYLGDHFKLPPSSMHLDISALLQQYSYDRGKRLAVTGPYQYLQCELVSLAYVLWSICFEKERFILLIADNHEQAKDMMSMIKNEITDNKFIKSDFPKVSDRNPCNWNSLNIITRNGINLRAAGFNKRHLNFRHQNIPPSLIIFNLPDDHDMTCYKKDVGIWRKWFDAQVDRNTTPNTNIIATGTFAPNQNSLFKDIFTYNNYKDWTSKRYCSIISESSEISLWKQWKKILNGFGGNDNCDPEAALCFFEENKEKMLAGTEVLWPEYEDYYQLMRQRNAMSPDKFNHFKLNRIYHGKTQVQKLAIDVATEIASSQGISLNIPINGDTISVEGLLIANGITDFDLDSVFEGI